MVLVCNPGGHTGATVMFELGGLVHSGAEVYFTHEPGESLIRAMADYAMSVCSAEELVEEMNSHNRTFNLREWPDADRVQASNFSLPQP